MKNKYSDRVNLQTYIVRYYKQYNIVHTRILYHLIFFKCNKQKYFRKFLQLKYFTLKNYVLQEVYIFFVNFTKEVTI